MENNPLRQYFRRPAVYLTLPSRGVGYTNSVVEIPDNGELPVYPMTAIDEITSRTPDALFNGTAVVEIIKSCVPSIKEPWEITSNDLDAILIAIKAAGGGESMDIDTVCPKCEETSTFAINLIGVLAGLQSADYSQELEVGNLKIKIRPLTFKEMNEGSMEQFEIQKTFQQLLEVEDQTERNKLSHQAFEQVTMLTMKLLGKTIEYIKTPDTQVTEREFILDFLQHCDKNIYTAIRDFSTDLKSKTELKPLDIQCPNCEHKYTQQFTMNPADFFG